MDDDDLDLEATASFSAILRPAAPPPAVAEGIGPLEITFHGFKTAAEAGDVRAAYRVGICLLEGRGCVQDLQAALAWLLRAADQRDLDAQVMVASCYLRGVGGPVNVSGAVQWLEIAARHGSAEAQFSLGDLHARGAGVKADKAAAAALWQDAAAQGYARAQLNLALAYVRGDGVPVDMPLALSWLTRAADSGYAKAEYNLGQLYLKGAPEWRNAEAARDYLRRAANRGFAQAQLAYGRVLQNADAPDALDWLRKAAAQELGQAAFALAGIFKSGGCGEVSNPAVADVWLRRAAELKYVPAQFELGRQGLSQTDDPLRLAESVRLIARAARKGHPPACYTLSACYARGLALEVDNARAWAWLTLAAQRGDARAELKLPELEARLDAEGLVRARDMLGHLQPLLPPVKA